MRLTAGSSLCSTYRYRPTRVVPQGVENPRRAEDRVSGITIDRAIQISEVGMPKIDAAWTFYRILQIIITLSIEEITIINARVIVTLDLRIITIMHGTDFRIIKCQQYQRATTAGKEATYNAIASSCNERAAQVVQRRETASLPLRRARRGR